MLDRNPLREVFDGSWLTSRVTPEKHTKPSIVKKGKIMIKFCPIILFEPGATADKEVNGKDSLA